MSRSEAEKPLVYVGTYGLGSQQGIYVYHMDMSSGALQFVTQVPEAGENPSFLAIHPEGSSLYAVNEIADFDGKQDGAVVAFSIARDTGHLTYLNRQPSIGATPCHLTVDNTGRFVLVANYNGGTVSVLPIREGGALGPSTDSAQHSGSSIHPEHQSVPHPHSINLDSIGRHAFAADKGIDKIMVYRLDTGQGKLVPHQTPSVRIRPGAGPRHFGFHPNGRHAYVINELDSTLTAFNYDAVDGTLAEIQTVSTLPKGFNGFSWCADVHVSPSGRFLYGSNRGHDSIAIFAIDGHTGKLEYVGHEPTQGETPRNFAIDPTGTFLLAANQDTGTIVTFRIEPESGNLDASGYVTKVPSPVCIKIISAYD